MGPDREAVTGKAIATLGNGIFVIETKHRNSNVKAKVSDRANVLIGKLGRSLAKPGLSRRSVFGDTPSKHVYSYYVDHSKPSKIVRESLDGTVAVGRVVGGKFRAD